MRLGLTFDLQTHPADLRQAEFDSLETIDALCDALETLGHSVTRLGNAQDLTADPRGVARVDLVFNIAEGSHGACREAWVPTLLELWGIPYVGSDAVALALGLDKVMCKRFAVASGVPTPRWTSAGFADSAIDVSGLTFPLIVKPRYEGSGVGIGPEAVVGDVAALRTRVQQTVAYHDQPCVIEEFIPYGELTVLVLGNDPPEALPVVQRPIDPVTRLACHVAPAPPGSSWTWPVELTALLDAQARRTAVTMFTVLGCCDMARVDLRVDAAGRLYFLEINPLPSFDPKGTIGLLAECLDTSYEKLVGRIVDAALRRLRLLREP